ncbi:MAG: DNA repair protein RecO [Bacteroidales bacterium]|nr:DNA repair protein RecO [Bacteroidales bacterium]
MILTTQGLVLHTTKYGETSVIAKIFTRQLGLCSYIVKGVRSASGRTKQNLLQPLSHLEMTVYNNPKHQLQYIKEMRPAAHYNNMHSDGSKLALLFFMDEVLYKSLKDEEQNQSLFDYVVSKLEHLDRESNITSMPIDFLIGTAHHLGIEPMDNYSKHEPLFNLKEGRFQAPPTTYTSATNPNAEYFLDAPSSSHIHFYLSSSMGRNPQPQLTARQRNATLNNLLEYYHVHLSDFRNFTSHEVLHSVLR